MANNLIFHTATRIIMRLTTDDNPPLRPFQSKIVVADDFRITGQNMILGLDNITQTPASTLQIQDLEDDIKPNLKRVRELNTINTLLQADAAVNANVKSFCNKLNDILRER